MNVRISRKIQVQNKNPEGFEHYEPYEISVSLEESDIPYNISNERDLTTEERIVLARDTIMKIIDNETFIMGVRTKDDLKRYKESMRERRRRERVYDRYRLNNSDVAQEDEDGQSD